MNALRFNGGSAGRLIRYPLLHQNFSTYFELSIHLTILEDGIL